MELTGGVRLRWSGAERRSGIEKWSIGLRGGVRLRWRGAERRSEAER